MKEYDSINKIGKFAEKARTELEERDETIANMKAFLEILLDDLLEKTGDSIHFAVNSNTNYPDHPYCIKISRYRNGGVNAGSIDFSSKIVKCSKSFEYFARENLGFLQEMGFILQRRRVI